MNELTQQGIQAFKSGDKGKARQLLQMAVQQDNRDVQALLWLSAVVDSDQEKIDCLQQVLRIDPNNQAAAKGIAQLISRGTASVQLGQTSVAKPSKPVLTIASSPQTEMAGVINAPSLPGQQPQDRLIFKLRPSLTPTMIAGGIAFLLIALVLLVFMGAVTAIFFSYGENSGGSLLLCLNVAIVILLLFPILRRLIVLLFTSYTLTQRHLIIDSGVLAKQHKTIPVQRIQDVAYHQTLLERMFGIGDVVVESAGEWGTIHLKDLADCKQRTQEILTVITKDGR